MTLQSNKVRIKKVVLLTAFILLMGSGYAAIAYFYDIGIPCVFRLITGFRCPGCGITHAILAMIRGNFIEAVRYNILSPVILLYILVMYCYCVYQYINTGKYILSAGYKWMDIMLLSMAIIWGVVRNFIGM